MSINKGRVAIVTGAGSGIGAGIAWALAKEGAVAVVADMNMDAAQKVAEEIVEQGYMADAVAVNVCDVAQCEAMINSVVEKYGTVDILVNNAGIIRDALIHKMTENEWDLVVDVILKGTFNCTQAAIKIMKTKKYGRIINISSCGAVGFRGQANYGAAKAGVVALTRTTVEEYSWCGVTANCIMPGPIKTPMTLASMQGKWEESVTPNIPVGRVGTPEDIAYMVTAFAAEEASFITGQIMGVDGGFDLNKF